MSIWTFFCCSQNLPKDIIHSKQTASYSQQSTNCSILQEKKNRYEGQLNNNIPHGVGAMIYGNGDYYRGTWVFGKREGKGIHLFHFEGYNYDGQWKNDEINGYGKLTLKNGSYYEGNFVQGKKNGSFKSFYSQSEQQFVEDYQNDQLTQKLSLGNAEKKNQTKKNQIRTQSFQQFKFKNEFIHFNPESKEYNEDYKNIYAKIADFAKQLNIDLYDWTVKEVLKFLTFMNMQSYKQAFYRNKIRGKDFFNLSEQSLKEDLYVVSQDRIKIIKYIKFLRIFYQEYKQNSAPTLKKRKRSLGFNDTKQKLKRKLKSVQNVIHEEIFEDWEQENSTNHTQFSSKVFKLVKSEECNINSHSSLTLNDKQFLKQ